MTRKDYELIADGIADAFAKLAEDGVGGASEYGVALAANRIARKLSADNPRFDRDRFLAAAHCDAA